MYWASEETPMTVLVSNPEFSKSECLAIQPEQKPAVEFFDQSGSSPPMDTLDWARDYKSRGWQPVPISRGEKGPKTHGWNTRIYSTEELPEHFGPDSNIGLLLGDPSGGLIDVDLDCSEAIQLASHFLPATDLKSGRDSAPSSHWWYRVGSESTENLKLTDPKSPSERTTIVEIRGGKLQTVVPPSIHPSQEQYLWEPYGEPAQVNFAELRAQVQKLAAAVLLVRAWRNGERQDIASSLISCLLRSGWKKGQIQNFIEPILSVAGDQEVQQRIYLVDYLQSRMNKSDPTPGLPMLGSFLGDKVVKRLSEWLGIKGTSQTIETSKSESNAPTLLELVLDADLFHDDGNQAYATVQINDHQETYRVRSSQFRIWLQQTYYRLTGTIPSRNAIDDAVNTAEAEARFGGKRLNTALRVGKLENNVFVDLCNENWEIVRITPVDWQVIPYSECPVRFVRADGMLSLPKPVRGGSAESLREFVSLATEDDWTLLLAWMIAAFVPGVPFALLSITGEQGSGKSTVTRMIRSLVDPHNVPLKGMPRVEEDIIINARNNHIVSYDNLSGISRIMSDAICRLSTGGGIAKRQLYTDGEEVSFSATRPVILNGIDDFASREDLVDRCLPIETKAVHAIRRTEEELWSSFEIARPHIFGSLLDYVSRALSLKNSTKPHKLARMADFYLIATAALGEAFEKAYWRRREQSTQQVIQSSAFAGAIVDFMRDRPYWEGSASELLLQLNLKAPTVLKGYSDWPKTASQITKLLNRKAADLRAVGIEFEKLPKSGTRKLRLSKFFNSGGTDSPPSEPSTAKSKVNLGLGQLGGMDGISSFCEESK
jgi:hypothetical protein